MKFQPTCSICLSKIRIIDFRYGSKRMGPGRKLLCKHIFHASCISNIYKPQCPLCEHPIFNKDEETLLNCSTEETAIHILKNMHERDINVKNVFTFLTTHESTNQKYKWIVNLMYKYCDFTELLADNLNDKTLVKEIVTKGKVNWFKTFNGGLTFSDLVYEKTTDPQIIEMVHDRLLIDPECKPIVIRPNNRPTSFMVPSTQHSQQHSDAMFLSQHSQQQHSQQQDSQTQPLCPASTQQQDSQQQDSDAMFLSRTPQHSQRTTYQRHGRVDSASGAILEHQLWGTQQLERTATIRRSLTGRESMYPSLVTHFEERPSYIKYSVYEPSHERLYPVIPSAPLLE